MAKGPARATGPVSAFQIVSEWVSGWLCTRAGFHQPRVQGVESAYLGLWAHAIPSNIDDQQV